MSLLTKGFVAPNDIFTDRVVLADSDLQFTKKEILALCIELKEINNQITH